MTPLNKYTVAFILIGLLCIGVGMLLGYYIGINIAEGYYLPQIEGCIKL